MVGRRSSTPRVWVEPNNEDPPNNNIVNNEILQIVRDLQEEIFNFKTEHERVLKTQENLNEALLYKLNDITNGKSKKKHKQENSPSDCLFSDGIHLSSELEYSSDSSKGRHSKKRKYKDELTGEFRKIKPPTFDDEVKNGEEAEAWLFGMKKYFTMYNYSNSMKEKMAIFNLVGKDEIWWQDLEIEK